MPPSKTANPDTPAQELAQLAARYPAQALANPVLPLLLLENPFWFSELPEKALLALLGALAAGPTPAPPALLAAATPHKSAAVRAAAAPPALLAALAQRSYPAQPWPVATDAAARHPRLPAAVLTALLAHPSEQLRAAASQNPALTPAGLRLLLQELPPKERLYIVGTRLADALGRPTTPPALLAEAARAKHPHIRQVAAAHPGLPPAELPRLLRDTAQQVRAAAAGSPHATPAQLTALAAGANATLREALAVNPATPPAVLATLAAAPEKETRARAAANPATPPAALAALATDPAPAVAQAALRNPLLPPELLAQRAATGDWHACALVALHPHCPPALLSHLARDQRNTTQYPVAAHPATPPEALALLHAREQAQPDRTLHRCLVLRQGHTPATAAQLLHHTAATDRALCLLLQLGYPALLSADNRATLATSPVAADRLSVAHLPEFQAQLRDDPHLLVRLVARGGAGSA